MCKVVLPGAEGPALHPTVVLLHGRGADENDLLGLADALDPRVLIVSVRAPFQFPHGGFTWYDLVEIGTPHQEQFTESYELLTTFVDGLPGRYTVNPEQIFLLGFSMGAVMAYALSLSKPRTIKGIVAHSGYVPEQSSLRFLWEDLHGVSFFVAHGIHDPVIPVQFSRRANELLSKTPADLTYREYPIQHQISQESLADLALWLRGKLEPSR